VRASFAERRKTANFVVSEMLRISGGVKKTDGLLTVFMQLFGIFSAGRIEPWRGGSMSE
jgi:hypothetical protein